jgi:diguanylate cyclase (GGDEF)-like protein
VAFLDLNQLSAVNERFGTAGGDAVIAWTLDTLRKNLPQADVVRAGGDEFVVILHGVESETALILLEDVRRFMLEHPPEINAGRRPDTGVSFRGGIVSYPKDSDNAFDMLRLADEAAYRALSTPQKGLRLVRDDRMVLKSSYYGTPQLDELAVLAARLGRTEASLLREALQDLLKKYHL